MNRIIHRVGALIAVLLMLWLSGTGSTIQVLDLDNVLTHADPTDPTAVSIAEGMYGPGNYAAIQLRDFHAATLPQRFDVNKAVRTVLQAAHAPQNPEGSGAAADAGGRGGAQSDATAWVELRVVDGVPIGQVMKGAQLEAFNALTGEPVTAVPPQNIPQGRTLPPSLRQKIKTLHRFWNRGDTPGVYFEFLSGLVLFTLLITGLIMYFKLLAARTRIGRRQLFWMTGGTWRGLHRGISVVAAVFLLVIAFTGTWIGFESSWGPIHRVFGAGPQGGGGGQRGPRVIPLSDADVQAMTAATLDAVQRLHPGTTLRAIRLRTFGTMKQGVVITGDARADQLVFNAATGQPATLTEPEYPKSNFPFGVRTHELVKHIHSGELIGVSGQFMNLFAGLSLIFLSVSGLIMYFDMWFKRRKSNRNSFFWK